MKNILQDIKKAYNARAYRSAFALALTLPDICGQIEYGDKMGSGERYALWIDNYLIDDEKSARMDLTIDQDQTFKSGIVQIDGKTYYRLRCVYLHSGITDLNDNSSGYPEFEFTLSSTEDSGIYTRAYFNIDGQNRLLVDIRGEIKSLLHSAIEYYKANTKKFCGDFLMIRDLEREEIIREKER